MNRKICIHGHFYQPPRENPWLEEIELQDSAQPYHDWNERITEECYAPNTASRILDSERRIVDVVNNYSRISFNFGPSLLSWMEKKAPEVYQDIVEADNRSQQRFSGHGAAIAQAFNHMILPLANRKDKRTQIIWGIEDFKHRFGRDPEGMWLPETAVNLETLDLLAEHGIKFTILAPRQAKRVRKIGESEWKDVSGEKIDPRRPYLCRLPSGSTINLFFYDGPVSKDVGFGNLLENGERFAGRLMDAFSDSKDKSQIVNIATDGETYGHHRRFADMTLARCLHKIESTKDAEITVYGEYLENNPPEHEVEIFENSSWSCSHGVERWRSNCGCSTGANASWTQEWRVPLRKAMDWLRDALIPIYEEEMSKYVQDPWRARDDYIEIVLYRSEDRVDKFLSEHGIRGFSEEEKVKVLKLLEMQRHAMLMYTSCGWFFDEISGNEGVQVMRYAARAMQLAGEVGDADLESKYLDLLKEAPSNVSCFKNGAEVFEKFVKTSVVDFPRLVAHYAVSSLFEEYSEEAKVYCFNVNRKMYDLEEMGEQKLIVGKTSVRSDITREEKMLAFSVLYMGGHNLIGGVLEDFEEEFFSRMQEGIKSSFLKSNILRAFQLIDERFGKNSYSLWHLFRDEQRKAFDQILKSEIKETEDIFRQKYEDIYPTIRAMREIQVPRPEAFIKIEELVLSADLRELFKEDDLDLERLEKLVEDVKADSIDINEKILSYEAAQRVNSLMNKLSDNPQDISLMDKIKTILDTLQEIELKMNLWKAQNAYFSIGKELYGEMRKKAEGGDKQAKDWVERFTSIGDRLNVKIS